MEIIIFPDLCRELYHSCSTDECPADGCGTFTHCIIDWPIEWPN